MERKSSWKATISFLKRGKLPWLHFALATAVPFLSTYLYVYLPELEGRIAAGEIFDRDLLHKYILLSVLLLALHLTTFYSAWVEIQFDRRIQKMTWRNLLWMPMGVFERSQPSSLISRITDDSTYVSQFLNYIISLVLSLYSAILMILSLFRMSSELARFTVPILLFNLIFVYFVQKKGYNVGYSIQDALSRYTSFLSERVHQLPLVKAAGMEEEEEMRGRELSDRRRREEFRAQKYEIIVSIAMEMTNILLVGIVLMGGAMEVKKGTLGMEDLIAFYILSSALPNTLQEMLFQILKTRQFHGAVEVITELATGEDREEGGTKETPAMEEGITFQNVRFAYPKGGGEVLKGVSFRIPKGKVTAILGPTGSGKTTVLKLLERFYEPESGNILYDGTPIGEFSPASWRNRFGYIVQNSPLISGTIRSNLLYGAGREWSDEELMDLVRKVQLEDFLASLEKGLDTPIEGNGENISGGQRQRIAIARALAAEPEILIMDEATSNLDAVNTREIHQVLREAMSRKTVVVVAHQMSTIRHADQILVMEDGKLLACGTHDSLIREEGYYQRYCLLQGIEA